MAERILHTDEAAGSKPAPPTIFFTGFRSLPRSTVPFCKRMQTDLPREGYDGLSLVAKKPVPRREFLQTAIKKGGATVLPQLKDTVANPITPVYGVTRAHNLGRLRRPVRDF